MIFNKLLEKPKLTITIELLFIISLIAYDQFVLIPNQNRITSLQSIEAFDNEEEERLPYSLSGTVVKAVLAMKQTQLNNERVAPVISNLQAAVLEAVPEMRSAKTDWQRAIILRDHVYSGNKVALPKGKPPIPLTVENYKLIVSGRLPQLCTGMALTYIGLLQSFGIPARLVNVASREAVNLIKFPEPNSKKSIDTHSIVEVFLDGRWIIQDPTFNIQWELDGKALNVLELREAFLSKKNPIPVSNDRKIFRGRSVQRYYIPYQDLLAYIDISEFEVLDPQLAGSLRPVATMPPGPSWQTLGPSSP
jgi:hypothetical protein